MSRAFQDLNQCESFKQVLRIILLLGNYMNAGSMYECSPAFSLKSLVKVCIRVIQYQLNIWLDA